ncbi:ankyrin repeat domain-containing protein, partial [Gemmatimonadota bacterium]
SAVYGRDFVSSVLESAGGAIIIITIVISFQCAQLVKDIFTVGELQWINAHRIPFIGIPDIFLWPWGLLLLNIWFPIIGFPLLWWRSRHSTVKRSWPSNPGKFRKRSFQFLLILAFILVPCTTVLPVILWPRVYFSFGEARLSTGDGIYLSDNSFSVEIHGDPEIPGRRPQDFKHIYALSSKTRLEKLEIINTRISNLEILIEPVLLHSLSSVHLANNPLISDLGPLYFLPLEHLRLEGKEIKDLAFMLPMDDDKYLRRYTTVEHPQLQGVLSRLELINTRVEDLGPVLQLEYLQYLDITGSPVKDPETLEELRDRGVEIVGDKNIQDDHTDLIHAARDGYTNIVEELLKDKIDVNEKNIFVKTALILAVRNDHIEVVQALTNAGANVNAKTNKGETALIIAASHGHIETVEALLKAGAEW